MKDSKKKYTAPQLTVAEFRTERGFAASDLSLVFAEPLGMDDQQYVEDYEVANGWTNNGSNSFWGN